VFIIISAVAKQSPAIGSLHFVRVFEEDQFAF
jgi:hypothetical protein